MPIVSVSLIRIGTRTSIMRNKCIIMRTTLRTKDVKLRSKLIHIRYAFDTQFRVGGNFPLLKIAYRMRTGCVFLRTEQVSKRYAIFHF